MARVEVAGEGEGGGGGGEVDVTRGKGDPGTEGGLQPGTGEVQTGSHRPGCEDETDGGAQQPHGQPGGGITMQQAPASNIINQDLKCNMIF